MSAAGAEPGSEARAVTGRPGPRALPFDQYQRYQLVTDLLASVRPDDRPLRVLDVGGATGLLRRFLPNDAVFAVDVYSEGPDPRLVLADGSRLPFAADTFDVVAAFDTLEHVPPPARAAFVAEVARVTRGWALLVGPYSAPDVAAAEVELDRFLTEDLGVTHAFLREHIEYGLPVREQVEQGFAEAGARVSCVGHGNLKLWQPLMRLELMLDDPALRPLGAALFELYARDLYAADVELPVYRHAVVAAFGDRPLPPASVFGPVDVARSRTARAALEGALNVLTGSAERMAWSAEREAFKSAVADVTADLEGHVRALAATRAELEEHRAAVAAYRQRVAELRGKTPSGRWRQLLGALGLKRADPDADALR